MDLCTSANTVIFIKYLLIYELCKIWQRLGGIPKSFGAIGKSVRHCSDHLEFSITSNTDDDSSKFSVDPTSGQVSASLDGSSLELSDLCSGNCRFEAQVRDLGGREAKIKVSIVPLSQNQIIPLKQKNVS